ncbi:MAG: UDP-glucose/GDP-mannose dehydrogenase family protein [Planctomycetota bacterium]|nr:MAG: UDP-glucose/GDP-mannose dehydrogenase family protein [Planctomycetota bacterium]
MRIAVVGAGYVGLVTGACFASSGRDVVFVDVDEGRLEKIRRGESPIYEPGLSEMLRRNLDAGRVSATSDATRAYREADAIFLCVGTPTGADGDAELGAVFACADQIAEALRERDAGAAPPLVVVKSTVPVGTTHAIGRRLSERSGGAAFRLANNPEFLREGSAIGDFLRPDRVIVGVEDEDAGALLRDLYEPFTRHGGAGVMALDIRSSEMVKYASNAMLATKISFINEIAGLCEAYGADVEAVRRGMCADERIGPHFLFPGLGYGGSCFPKDVRACLEMGRRAGVATELLAGVDAVNRRQRARFAERVAARFEREGGLAGRRLAVWGVSFKPNTDDIREAPAVDIIRALAERGAGVTYFDPEAEANARGALGDVADAAPDPYLAAVGADALLLCTEWDEFTSPDFDRLRRAMARPIIFDGRNVMSREHALAAGFELYSVGRPDAARASVEVRTRAVAPPVARQGIGAGAELGRRPKKNG